jgi:hypothetical protein
MGDSCVVEGGKKCRVLWKIAPSGEIEPVFEEVENEIQMD